MRFKNKTHNLGYLKIITLFIMIIFLSNSKLIFNSENDLENSNKSKIKTAYDPLNPILISGNSDFQDKAILYGWNGTGIEGDPYIIYNVNITSTSTSINLVDISHTRAYFILESNLLEGGASGIRLHNVSNAILQQNIINNCNDFGILLENSSLNLLKNNTVTNTATGVYLIDSNKNDFLENIISNTTLNAFLCDNYGFNVIHNNTVRNAGLSGLKFRDSPQNLISDNIVVNCEDYGIQIAASGMNVISNNTVVDNIHGIYLMGASNDCNISDNLVYNSYDCGILIESSSFIKIDHNTIYNNSFFGIRILSGDYINVTRNNLLYNLNQAGATGTNLDFSYNYWTDWVVPDENDDNYIDLPYNKEPSFQDPYPLAKAYICEKIHLLTLPMIVTFNESIISGIVELSWGIASDTKGHYVTYQLYYSPDAGDSWNLVSANLINNHYYWDTNSITDGDGYMLKVVANCSDGLISEDISKDTFAIRNSPHTLSEPIILSPLPGEISESPVLIEWSPSIDSWGFLVKYSLYYSPDNGTTWFAIIEQIYNTNYSLIISESNTSLWLKIFADSQGGITNESISGPYTFKSQEFPETRIGIDLQLYVFTFILIGTSIVILSKRNVIKKN